jgi:PAS domain S-box-containing protein
VSPESSPALAVLEKIGATLERAKSFEDAWRDALWLLVRATEIDSASIFAVGQQGFYRVVARSDDDAPVEVSPHPQAQSELSRTMDEGEARELESADGRIAWHFPLRASDEVVGVLELHWNSTVAAWELALARTLATFIGPAMCATDLPGQLPEWPPGEPEPGPNLLFKRRALDKYREFFRRAADGVAVLDTQGTVLLLNPAAQQITGYAAAGLIGRDFREIVHSEDRDAFRALVDAASQGSLRSMFHVRLVTTSNDTIVSSFSTSLLSEHQDLIVLSFRDITVRRYLSEELRRTTSFLERLIDSAYDAIVATDVSGLIVLFNTVAEHVFARRSDDVVGNMTVDELYPAEVLARIWRHLESKGAERDPDRARQEFLRDEIVDANGHKIPVQISGSLLFDEGVQVGAVINISDLREKLRMERQLIQTEERLVETEKQALIAELAGTTAHELNQPLTSIMGYAELLQRRVPLGDPSRRAAEVIFQESERMAEIVRQIGQITRYQTKTYVGGTQILDLERSSQSAAADDGTEAEK